MSVMRGILISEFGGPTVLKYKTDIPVPPKPTGQQVLVRVKAVGVNPVDTYIRSGTHNIKPPLPYIPGGDGSGIVEEVGEAVKKLKKGDHICWGRAVSGCYAELALVSEREIFTLSSRLSFQQGAAIGVPYTTAYRAIVTKGHLRPGERVFVHGASGAVGLASCQIARSLGAYVVGTAGTEDGKKLLLSNGAHLVFNHREDGYIDKIKAEVKGFDLIVEMLANVNLEKDLDLAGPDGRIGIVGSRGVVEVSPRKMMSNELNVFGVMLYRSSDADWNEMQAFFAAGQETGWLRPVVGREFPLEQADQAHVDVVEHKNGSAGKIVLNV